MTTTMDRKARFTRERAEVLARLAEARASLGAGRGTGADHGEMEKLRSEIEHFENEIRELDEALKWSDRKAIVDERSARGEALTAAKEELASELSTWRESLVELDQVLQRLEEIFVKSQTAGERVDAASAKIRLFGGTASRRPTRLLAMMLQRAIWSSAPAAAKLLGVPYVESRKRQGAAS